MFARSVIRVSRVTPPCGTTDEFIQVIDYGSCDRIHPAIHLELNIND